MHQQAIRRIIEMEYCFDLLLHCAPEAIRQDPVLRRMHRELVSYYDNGQWLSDYTLDESGSLPQWLKRGVLSQDGLYNLLCRLAAYEEFS